MKKYEIFYLYFLYVFQLRARHLGNSDRVQVDQIIAALCQLCYGDPSPLFYKLGDVFKFFLRDVNEFASIIDDTS